MTTNESRPPMVSRKGGGRNNTNGGHTQYSTGRGGGQLIYSAAGRPIATLRGGVVYKTVSSARGHMVQKPRGWALDTASLEQIAQQGGQRVELTDETTRLIYRASLETFQRYGVAFERGYGPQVCLPLHYWSIDGQPPTKGARPSEPDTPPEPETPSEPAAMQYSLW